MIMIPKFVKRANVGCIYLRTLSFLFGSSIKLYSIFALAHGVCCLLSSSLKSTVDFRFIDELILGAMPILHSPTKLLLCKSTCCHCTVFLMIVTLGGMFIGRPAPIEVKKFFKLLK